MAAAQISCVRPRSNALGRVARALIARTVMAVLATGFVAQAQDLSGTAAAVSTDGSLRALIVGIDEYQNIDGRTQAVSGAQRVRDLLVERHRLEPDRVTMLLDEQATRTRIMLALSDLSDAAPDDRIFIYFAGLAHTTGADSADADGYLLPVDAEVYVGTDSVATGLGMSYLRKVLSQLPSKNVLVLLDAAISGMGATYPRLEIDSALAAHARYPISEADGVEGKPPRIRHVLTAGRAGETGLDRTALSQSPFTIAVLSGLGTRRADADGDGTITSFELAGYLERVVYAASDGELHPQIRSFSEDSGAITFLSPTESTPPVEADLVARAEEAPLTVDRELSALVITSMPDSAQLYIDGRALGATPLEIDGLLAGDVTVELIKQEYLLRALHLFLPEGTIVQLHAELLPNRGAITLQNLPEDARLVIDGEAVEPAPGHRHELPVGDHRAEVHFGGERFAAADFRLRPKEERTLLLRRGVFSLQSITQSIVAPGFGQILSGARTKGRAISIGTAALGAATAVAQLMYSRARSDYHDSRDAYVLGRFEEETVRLREEMLVRYDRSLHLNKLRSIGVGALAALYGYNLLDVIVFHSRIDVLEPRPPTLESPELTFRPLLTPALGGLALGIRLDF